MLKWIGKIWLGCAIASLAGQAMADEFPSKPIKIVVGFGPGGVADICARMIAQKMSASMGKPIIVENSPSAGGIVAALEVAKAAPDGYTLLLVSNQNAVSPALMKKLPYDPVKDFSMISTIGYFNLVLVTNPSSPYKSVKDVIAAAKSNPARFNLGTIGVGSTQHLSAELFKSLANLDVPTVPYKASGNVILAVKSGDVQVGFETLPAVVTQISSKGLRAIATTSSRRIASLPDVPTVAETLPGYEAISWNALAAPAKTPRAIIDRLNHEMTNAISSPDMQKRLQDIGVVPMPSSPEAATSHVQKEVVKWRGVVERAKIEKQ